MAYLQFDKPSIRQVVNKLLYSEEVAAFNVRTASLFQLFTDNILQQP